MPWRAGKRKTKQGWPIIRGKGKAAKVVGHSKTKAKAQASVRARYANYKGK